MPDPSRPASESRDANPRAILWFGFGLLCTMATAFVGLHYFQTAFGGSANPASSQPNSAFGSPPLQTAATADLARLRAEEKSKLHAYGWIDRRDGIIRLPIERAMELTAQRGLPTRPPSKGATP